MRSDRLGPLDPIYDVDTQYGAIAAGNSPAVPLITVTIDVGASQPDPAYASPIVFDVVFSEVVSGFTGSDVTLGGTAAPTTAVVSGAGAIYSVLVSGMSGSGTVNAVIPAGRVYSPITGGTNYASTSTDNEVDFFAPPTGAVHWFDFSDLTSLTFTGPNINTATDLISGLVLTSVGTVSPAGTIGNAGLASARAESYGVSTTRMANASGSLVGNQPIWVSAVAHVSSGAGGYKGSFFELSSGIGPQGRTGNMVGELDNHVYLEAGSSIEGAFNSDGYAHVYFWIFDGASSFLYMDGQLIASGNGGTNPGTLGGALTLFNAHGGGYTGDVTIGEIVFGIGAVPTAFQVAAEHERLRAKWELPSAYANAFMNTVIVPNGVTSCTVDVRGAADRYNFGGEQGKGGIVTGSMSVTPGATLYVSPGGTGALQGAGGFNGGGDNGGDTGQSGFGGGGASDIRQGGTGLANRIIVGGGAGGGAFNTFGRGGHAGYTTAGTGLGVSGSGTGGSQVAGGGGGINGTLGQGASTPHLGGGQRSGGGGGGGYYGGGAVGTGFGVYYSGGGGSSYYDAGAISGVSIEAIGSHTTTGQVIITWNY